MKVFKNLDMLTKTNVNLYVIINILVMHIDTVISYCICIKVPLY